MKSSEQTSSPIKNLGLKRPIFSEVAAMLRRFMTVISSLDS